jgi:hypothetical protein
MTKTKLVTEIRNHGRAVFTQKEYKYLKFYLIKGKYNSVRYMVSDKVEKVNKINIQNNIQRKHIILLDRLEDLTINLCSI